MISVIIPTYKSPEVLDLCIKSALQGQFTKNEIIVVVDGTYDINLSVLEKYDEEISILNLPSNVGTCRATNLGAYNATSEKILIVNDDNVFPKNWDIELENSFEENSVITPNQIEPYPSMFKQFFIKDLGRTPSDFDPSQAGYVSDWDFFLKCELSGMQMKRLYSIHFYHFVSVSAKSSEQIDKSREEERVCHEYFYYKWGDRAQHDSNNNSKMISKYK